MKLLRLHCRAAFLAGSALFSAVFLACPAQAADDSVAQRLHARSVEYKVDEDGDYRITYSYKKEGRTQLVFVSGKTEDIGGMTIREVFSPAATLSKDDIGGKAIPLLKDSGGAKIGAWEIRGDVLYFVIKVPEPMNAEQLEKFMDLAAGKADDMEIEISGPRDAL